MEISLQAKQSLRIKGKQSSIIVHPSGKHDENASLFLDESNDSRYSSADGVVIASPGEYEVGGIKIRGQKTDSAKTFSLIVDGVEVLLGRLSALEKAHGKLQEYNVVVVDVDTSVDPSFASSLATNVLILTGEKAQDLVATYIKENVKTMSKFVSTRDKLPSEVETILLSA